MFETLRPTKLTSNKSVVSLGDIRKIFPNSPAQLWNRYSGLDEQSVPCIERVSGKVVLSTGFILSLNNAVGTVSFREQTTTTRVTRHLVLNPHSSIQA